MLTLKNQYLCCSEWLQNLAAEWVICSQSVSQSVRISSTVSQSMQNSLFLSLSLSLSMNGWIHQSMTEWMNERKNEWILMSQWISNWEWINQAIQPVISKNAKLFEILCHIVVFWTPLIFVAKKWDQIFTSQLKHSIHISTIDDRCAQRFTTEWMWCTPRLTLDVLHDWL